MKKVIVAALIISLCFGIIILSKQKEPLNQGDDSTKDVDYSSEKPEGKGEVFAPELQLLYGGKLDDAGYKIGDNYDSIIIQLGTPNAEAAFMGGTLLEYDEIYFFFNDNIVSAIYYIGTEKIYGVQRGMTLEQAKAILGEPNHAYTAIYDELFPDESLIAVYRAGEYITKLEINPENDKIQSISIWLDDGKREV